MIDVLIIVLAGILGLLVGAIINALSDDLPAEKPVSLPHYPNGIPRAVSAWSGIIAFLTGQREGRSIEYSAEEEKKLNLSLEEIADLMYDTVLGWRHPIVEIGMAAIFIYLATQAPDLERGIIWGIYLSILMLITVIDLEHRLILYVVIVPSVIITLIIDIIFPGKNTDGTTLALTDYLLGSLMGGGVFFVIYLGGGAFSNLIASLRGYQLNEVAFGFGDVMLGFLCGLMIGWRSMLLALFITIFAGAAGAILYLIAQLFARRRYAMYTALPYGPYIVFGTALMLVFSEDVRALIFNNWK